MKLYNTYKKLILENVRGTIDQLIDGEQAANGRRFYRAARIWYRDAKTATLEERYVFIYGRGKNKKGNEVIRAFQAFGGTRTKNSNWKTFLIDNITKIEITDAKWYKPVDQVKGGEGTPKYVGPSDKTMGSGSLDKYVKF